MIFYFTGTGNSLAAAQRIAKETGDELYNIADVVKTRKFTYEVKPSEKVGFVFPVYFGGTPNIVNWFIRNLDLSGSSPEFTYAVMTNGGGPAGADRIFTEKMEAAGYLVDSVYEVTMPDNYVVMYDVPSEEAADEILAKADVELDYIIDAILSSNEDCEGATPYESGPAQIAMSKALYPLYGLSRKTKKFWVDDRCVGCGACASRCACHAIEMVDGKPTWVKDRCIFCLGCTNRCGAIQYGKGTVNRGRYKNPVFAKKSHSHCEE